MTNSNVNSTGDRGYQVDVIVLGIDRIDNSADGNPRYRFNTDTGVYATANDLQQSMTLTGDETGPAMLRIENARVIGWEFIEPQKEG